MVFFINPVFTRGCGITVSDFKLDKKAGPLKQSMHTIFGMIPMIW